MYRKTQTVFAVIMCLCVLLLSSCKKNGSNELQQNTSKPNDTVTEINSFEDLLDENGKINVDYLNDKTVSVIKNNYDDRVYIEHKGKPHYYNPVYISYDQIIANTNIAADKKDAVLEEAFSNAMQCGFKSVALYVNWKDFYNGTSYNFDYYKIYYTLAEKYDLKLSIIWNGYAKTGFMPWQTDRTKYPALTTELEVNVPDLSQQIYIDEAVEAITQFCGWLNFVDNNCRTVSIQLEDEANTDFGNGNWLSQYSNYSVILEKMAKAVKSSPYKMVTTVGLSFDDYYVLDNDISGKERFSELLSKKSIDGVGLADLISSDASINVIDNSKKLCYVSKLSPATYDFFERSLSLIKQGYSFGVYELKSFDFSINCGIYRTHSTNWLPRDRQNVNHGILAKKRSVESATADVIDYIKAINSIGEILAVNSTADICVMNIGAVNNFVINMQVGDTSLAFDNSINPAFTYNSAGICVVDPYSNYYIFAFHGTPTAIIHFDSDFKYSEGFFENGEWVANGEEIPAQNNSISLKSGTVYKFGVEKQ